MVSNQQAKFRMRIYRNHVEQARARIKQNEDIIQRSYNEAYALLAKVDDNEWEDQAQLDKFMADFDVVDTAHSQLIMAERDKNLLGKIERGEWQICRGSDGRGGCW